MNHDIVKTLKKYGLSENEAKVYCSLLALEEGTVDAIAMHAELNRTSSYPVLERLKALGLVGQTKKKKKTVFKAVSPEKLLDLLEDKKESLMAVMPNLKSLLEISRGRPDVSFFEGQEGLKTVLNSILAEAKEVCILGEGESFLNAIPGWNEAYVEKRKGRRIKVKLILKATSYALKSIKKMQESGNEYLKIRVLPEFYKINHGGFDLYSNKSIFYSFEKNYHAVVIDSGVINQVMRTVFDILWETAERYNYLIQKTKI